MWYDKVRELKDMGFRGHERETTSTRTEGFARFRDRILYYDHGYHVAYVGQTGSGKDTAQLTGLERDVARGRTVIVFGDRKAEYAAPIFPNTRPEFQEQMRRWGVPPRSLKIHLWVMYNDILTRSRAYHLLKMANHPNLKVHFFRLHWEELESNEVFTLALGTTDTQRHLFQIAKQKALRGEYTSIGEAMEDFVRPRSKEEIEDGDIGLADRRSKSMLMKRQLSESSGILDLGDKVVSDEFEYLTMPRILAMGGVHVFSTAFSFETSAPELGTSIVVALLCELMAALMDPVNVWNEVALHMSELWTMCPKRPPDILAKPAQISGFRIGKAMRLMRGYGLKLRVNTQGPSEIYPGILGQCQALYVGRLNQPKDLDYIAKLQRLSWTDRNLLQRLKAGQFVEFFGARRRLLHFLPPSTYKMAAGEKFLDLLARGGAMPESARYYSVNEDARVLLGDTLDEMRGTAHMEV